MGRCNCGSTCQCSLSGGNCIAITGTGTTASPLIIAPIVSADAGNLLECRATGLYAPNNAAWTAYTPTFVNLTVGNGVLTAAYQKIGRVVHFYIKFVLGSTSSVGSNPTYTFPVAAAARYSSSTIDVMAQVAIADTGTANFMGVSYWGSSITGQLQALTAGGTYVSVSSFTSLVPMTWAATDAFVVWGTYEAAA